MGRYYDGDGAVTLSVFQCRDHILQLLLKANWSWCKSIHVKANLYLVRRVVHEFDLESRGPEGLRVVPGVRVVVVEVNDDALPDGIDAVPRSRPLQLEADRVGHAAFMTGLAIWRGVCVRVVLFLRQMRTDARQESSFALVLSCGLFHFTK